MEEDGAVTAKQVNREGAVTVVTQTHMEGEEFLGPLVAKRNLTHSSSMSMGAA